jgi:hypothetical protein
MKKLFSLLAMIMITSQLFAQTQKVYLTKSGKFTADANKATGYLLVQKLTGSEGYQATQYDMHNTLVSKGTYKDESLTVPSGKFVYYAKPDKDQVFRSASYKGEDKYYLSSTGYYVNGKRAGVWTEYTPTGEKMTECTYENGVLNGPYKAYANNFSGEGNAVNGKIEGKFTWYTNGLLAAEIYYENGKVASKTEYLKPAEETRSLGGYLNSKLRKYSKVIYDSKLVIKYTVDENGKVTNASVVEGYSAEINKSVVEALTNYDGFTPAKYNGKAIAQDYTQTFNLYGTQLYDNPYAAQNYVNNERCEMHSAPNPGSTYFNGNIR